MKKLSIVIVPKRKQSSSSSAAALCTVALWISGNNGGVPVHVHGFKSHINVNPPINGQPHPATSSAPWENGAAESSSSSSSDGHHKNNNQNNDKNHNHDNHSASNNHSASTSNNKCSDKDSNVTNSGDSASSSSTTTTPYLSSTVRRWNQYQSTTSTGTPAGATASPPLLKQPPSSLLSPDFTLEDYKEHLLIVQESQDAATFRSYNENDQSQAGLLNMMEDEQVVVFGREEEAAEAEAKGAGASTHRPSPGMPLPTFGTPNAFSFQYKRYHSGMAPSKQLFHTVTMNGNGNGNGDRKYAPSPSSSSLFSAVNMPMNHLNTGVSDSFSPSSPNHAGLSDTDSSPGANNNNKNAATAVSSSNFQVSASTHNSNSNTNFNPNVPQTLRHYWRPLLQMCRLRNLPGVVLFHLVAVHLAHRVALVSGSGVNNIGVPSLLSLLCSPGMMSTLVVTMLISCISMLFNDYYDAKSGVDLVNSIRGTTLSSSSTSKSTNPKPLATGEVPLTVARQCITLLAIATLFTMMVLPGIAPKLAALSSGIIVYYYTQYLKPQTWIKNISCASLIAASPLVSALAAWHTITTMTVPMAAGGSTVAPTSTMTTGMTMMTRLMASIFAWSMSRELTMDIGDHKGDKAVGVPTVSVKYGKRFASQAALMFAAGLSVAVTSGPLVEVLAMSSSTSTASIHVLPPLVRLVLSVAASGWMMLGAYKVCRDEGTHNALTNQVVEGTMISALLTLMSFV
jgi:4-hydroxybenzoate polyprenyltransferase